MAPVVEKKYEVVCLPGDGIGPEIMRECRQVLELIDTHRGGNLFHFVEGLVGGAAYEVHGCHLPPATLALFGSVSPGKEKEKEETRRKQAILFGAVGGRVDQQDEPKWKDAERNSLLHIRKHLQLRINVRPTLIYPQLKHLSPLKDRVLEKTGKGPLDIIVVRELLSGIYFGKHATHENEEGETVCEDVMSYKYSEVEVAVRHAFLIAQKRKAKKLCVVDKANVLDCSRLWRKVARDVHKEFDDVELSFLYVDNAAMQMILDPCSFSVIVSSNMFGDILSDLASALPGSLGLMPSASLGGQVDLYEPAGGSAPDLAGKNRANPTAQILSGAMMLRHSFGMETEARAIDEAVQEVLEAGHRTADMCLPGETPLSTSAMGDRVRQLLETKLSSHPS